MLCSSTEDRSATAVLRRYCSDSPEESGMSKHVTKTSVTTASVHRPRQLPVVVLPIGQCLPVLAHLPAAGQSECSRS